MKVFLVEDSPAVCEGLRGMMAGIPGVDVVAEADNEDDAVQGIGLLRPDTVILDLTLAKGSGIGVLRRIRSQALAVRVIVLTNYNQPQYRNKCLDLGADYFLDKTKDISELEALLPKLAAVFSKDASLASPT